MNSKKIIPILMAVAFLTACGNTSETESISESQIIITTTETDSEKSTTSESTSDTTEKSTAAEKITESTLSTSTLESATKSDTSATSTNTTKSGSSKTSTTTESKSSNTSAKTEITSKNAETTQSTAITTETQTTSTEEATEPESPYDEEFNLDETPVINISSGGDYIVRGYASEGQIYVDAGAEEKVEITLDGVDLSCSYSSAILVNQCKRCVLKLADGSVNYLQDGGSDAINDGVIFSNDTIRIKGGGTLEITAGNAHGIASDDDVIIEDGTYVINAIKSGIFAHDDITINGGDLNIYGNTNGIKSKGTVNINGGNMYISGGSKEEKSSIYSAAAFYYTGGNVFAAGNKVTVPENTPNPYIVVNYVNGASVGSSVGLCLNGFETAVISPHNDFRCVLMLTPDIISGDTFTAYLNGNPSEDFIISDGQNLFTIE